MNAGRKVTSLRAEVKRNWSRSTRLTHFSFSQLKHKHSNFQFWSFNFFATRKKTHNILLLQNSWQHIVCISFVLKGLFRAYHSRLVCLAVVKECAILIITTTEIYQYTMETCGSIYVEFTPQWLAESKQCLISVHRSELGGAAWGSWAPLCLNVKCLKGSCYTL